MLAVVAPAAGGEGHSAGMADHLARAQRHNRAAFLLVALGVGLMVFALVDADSRRDPVDSTSPALTSAPTVLGAVVTRPALAAAAPAAAVELDLPTGTADRTTIRPTRRPEIGEALTIENPDSATPPPQIGDALTIERSTTTTSSTSSTTSSTSSTSTTESTTTTTDGPTSSTTVDTTVTTQP